MAKAKRLKSKSELSRWTERVLRLRGRGVVMHKGKRGGHYYIKSGRRVYVS